MMRRWRGWRRFWGWLINGGLRNRNEKLPISARHGNSRFLFIHDHHTSRATPLFSETLTLFPSKKRYEQCQNRRLSYRKEICRWTRTFRDLLPQYWLLVNPVAFSDSKLGIKLNEWSGKWDSRIESNWNKQWKNPWWKNELALLDL